MHYANIPLLLYHGTKVMQVMWRDILAEHIIYVFCYIQKKSLMSYTKKKPQKALLKDQTKETIT